MIGTTEILIIGGIVLLLFGASALPKLARSIAKAKMEGFPVNIYNLPKEEQARWLEVGGKPTWDWWLAKMKKEGHPEAKEILDALLGMF